MARVSASCRHVASAQCRIIWRRRRRPALVQRASSNPFRSWFRQTELLGRNQAASCNVPCRPATKFCQPSFLWALAAGRALSHFNVGHHRGRAPGHTEMLRDHPDRTGRQTEDGRCRWHCRLTPKRRHTACATTTSTSALAEYPTQAMSHSATGARPARLLGNRTALPGEARQSIQHLRSNC